MTNLEKLEDLFETTLDPEDYETAKDYRDALKNELDVVLHKAIETYAEDFWNESVEQEVVKTITTKRGVTYRIQSSIGKFIRWIQGR